MDVILILIGMEVGLPQRHTPREVREEAGVIRRFMSSRKRWVSSLHLIGEGARLKQTGLAHGFGNVFNGAAVQVDHSTC